MGGVGVLVRSWGVDILVLMMQDSKERIVRHSYAITEYMRLNTLNFNNLQPTEFYSRTFGMSLQQCRFNVC